MKYNVDGFMVELSIQSVQGKTRYNSKITKSGKLQAVIMDLRGTGHGFVPQANCKLAELHAVGLHVLAVDMFRDSGKIAHVEIHDIQKGKVRIIESGDNNAWSSLDSADKNGVRSCIQHKASITMGKFIYIPVR